MLLKWLHPELTSGTVVDLRVESEEAPGSRNSYVPSVIFAICPHGSRQKIGECDLRIGMNEELYYAGNVGYRIYKPYRGNGYAYEACRLLLPLARSKYGMKELIITCSPDNEPSRKTLEKLGGSLVATVDVPHEHWLYKRGETTKNIYHFELS